jgi:hypothetical protein
MQASRRFPPPWIVEEHTESFIVRDASGQALHQGQDARQEKRGVPSLSAYH